MSGFGGRRPRGTVDSATGAFVIISPDEKHDPFGRLRVSNNHILLTAQQDLDNLPLVWDTKMVGSASTVYHPNTSSTHMVVNGDPGDLVIRQTKRYWRYRAGQGQEISMTFADGYMTPGIRKRVGYFDGYNGIFLEVTGDDVAMVLRSSVSGSTVDQRIVQSQWNRDIFNARGPSGITLDLTKSQIFIIDLQWLGVGRVRVGFHIDGRVHYAHEFDNANNQRTVYMSTATLPVRYEIESVSASAGGSFDQICAAVVREGGVEEGGIPTAAFSGFSNLTATTTLRSALSIRIDPDYIGASIEPTSVNMVNQGANQTVHWRLVLNPQLSGSLTWADGYGQISQQSVTQLAYTGGTGHVVASGYIASQTKDSFKFDFQSLLGLAADIDGIPDVLSLIVQSTGTATIESIISYLEIY